MRHTRLILEKVFNERMAQHGRFGEQDHSDEEWLTILVEEVGEAAKAILKEATHAGLEMELIQIAAVAVAWHEARWRRSEKPQASGRADR